jgi:hypothetical protein
MISIFLILFVSSICIELFIKLNVIKILKELNYIIRNLKNLNLFDKSLSDDTKQKAITDISINLFKLNLNLLISFIISLIPFLILIGVDIFTSLDILFYIKKIEIIILTILYIFVYKILRQKLTS